MDTAATSLATTAEPVAEIETVALEGRIDALTASATRAKILAAGGRARHVIVDLRLVEDMDAAGLAAIIGPRRRLQGLGVTVTIEGALDPRVRRTLVVTRFALLFDLGDLPADAA